MASAEAVFQVDGREFRLTLTKTPAGMTVTCDPSDGASVLGVVVGTAWMRDPAALLRAVDGRTGLSFEGEVSFEFDDEGAAATLAAHDREETVPASLFERFVVEYGLACIDAATRVDVDAGTAFGSDLTARRIRLAA
jgi:hypothetical protein